MYDFMEVDYNDATNLREAIAYWKEKAEAETFNAFMALNQPVTENVQNYSRYMWKALQFSDALIKLLERSAVEEPAKKSVLKKLLRK